MAGAVSDRRELEIEDTLKEGGLSERRELELRDELAGETSFGRRAGAFAKGFGTGLVESAPIAVGMGAGAAVGGPVGMVAGGLVGAGVTMLASPELDLPEAEDLPTEQRPFFFAGQTLGGSAPFAALPFGAAATGFRFAQGKVGTFLNRIITEAVRRPTGMVLAEGGMASSAALAAGLSETQFPGRAEIRIPAEIVGGMLNPTRLMATAVDLGIQGGRRLKSVFSRTAQESRAAAEYTRIITELGEDPAAVTKALKQSSILKHPTAAQLTGSPALGIIEAKLRSESARFGRESANRADENLGALKTMIKTMEDSGDPAALKEAAELRGRYFETLLQGRLNVAERRAIETAGRIAVDSPEDAAKLSKQVGGLVDAALVDARAAETQLWGQIPKSTPAEANTVEAVFAGIKDEMLPEESLPAIAEGFVKRMGAAREEAPELANTTAGELLRFRSRMLANARQAMAKQEFNDARVFGELAEAALDDLGDLHGVDKARDFSRALNDTFTRTFAGETKAKLKTGARRIPPELVMPRALAGGADARNLRFSELEEALRFGVRNAADNAAANVAQESFDEMLDLQARMIRLAAANTIDPVTGRVGPRQLAKFRRDNAAVLNRMPEVDRSLSDAQTAQRELGAVQESVKRGRDAIRQRAAFMRLTGTENPTAAVAQTLASANPNRELRQLTRLAKRSGPDAVRGLRRALFEDAYQKAGGDAAFSFEAYRKALFEPARAGQKPIVAMMRENKLIPGKQTRLLEKVLKEAAKVEATVKAKPDLDTLITGPDAVIDLATRIAGARLAVKTPLSTGSGAELVVAQRGSAFMRQVIDKIPTGKTMDIMVEMAENPEFAAALMSRATSPHDKIRLARDMHAFLFRAGLVELPREAQEEVERIREKRQRTRLQGNQ